MKSLKQRLKKHETSGSSTDWSKYDERLLRAVENGDVDKVAATLKKGAIATKLDAEGNSALHLAASKGLINSLNVFLAHGVNLHITDGPGKTALHLSARGGHSACVQRLLQCKSPVDSTDLQGRTALHEAAYAGHTTIIKLLCGGGASVSAVDKDGWSPLLLAAQMGHPRACQYLLNCGASISLRDKQNKTALILACERRYHEVVEVLLKHKADATAVDHFGHDSYHYARLSENKALITMVKQVWEATTKEAPKTAQIIQQQSPSPGLPYGISRSPTEVVKLEKAPLLQHTRERGSHSENDRDYLQSHYLDYAQFQVQNLSVADPVREADFQRGELWEARRRQKAAYDEVLRLDGALALLSRDYDELKKSSERALREAHSHAWNLEEALAEVQRRMADSEARVKQMQVHLMTVREKLVEELRVQLLEAKAELQLTREELDQSRREAREPQEQLYVLQQEIRRLTVEFQSKEDTKALQKCSQETQRVEKAIQTSLQWNSTNSKTTMTDLTLETLQRDMDKKGYINLKEHEEVRNSLSTALQQTEMRAQEALLKQQQAQEANQNLLVELKEQKTELDIIQEAIQARFVPVAKFEEKERELAELRLALKQMKEDKEKEKIVKETQCQQESQRELHTKQAFQDHRNQQTTCKTIEFSVQKKNELPDPPEAQDKDSELLVKAEGQKETQGGSSTSKIPFSCVHSDSTTLQAHINSLQQQLENSERRYKQILDVYRTRLLSAAQGYMDEEARVALLQIAQMRQECVC